MITSLQIGMFRYCLKASEQIKMYMEGSVYLKTSQVISAAVVLSILMCITLFIFYFLMSRKSQLDHPEMIAKCGNFFGSVKVYNDWQLFRFPVQLTFIFAFALICSMLFNFSGLQVISVILLHLLLLGFMFNSTVLPRS